MTEVIQPAAIRIAGRTIFGRSARRHGALARSSKKSPRSSKDARLLEEVAALVEGRPAS
jgi:hypothetical protein